MQLGATLFAILTVLTGFYFAHSLRRASRFPLWRYALVEIALVGLLINTNAEWWVYPLMGFTLVLTATFATSGLEHYDMQRVGIVAIWSSVVFGLSALMFAFQPAPPLGLAWVLVVFMLCTYVEALNRWYCRVNPFSTG